MAAASTSSSSSKSPPSSEYPAVDGRDAAAAGTPPTSACSNTFDAEGRPFLSGEAFGEISSLSFSCLLASGLGLALAERGATAAAAAPVSALPVRLPLPMGGKEWGFSEDSAVPGLDLAPGLPRAAAATAEEGLRPRCDVEGAAAADGEAAGGARGGNVLFGFSRTGEAPPPPPAPATDGGVGEAPRPAPGPKLGSLEADGDSWAAAPGRGGRCEASRGAALAEAATEEAASSRRPGVL